MASKSAGGASLFCPSLISDRARTTQIVVPQGIIVQFKASAIGNTHRGFTGTGVGGFSEGGFLSATGFRDPLVLQLGLVSSRHWATSASAFPLSEHWRPIGSARGSSSIGEQYPTANGPNVETAKKRIRTGIVIRDLKIAPFLYGLYDPSTRRVSSAARQIRRATVSHWQYQCHSPQIRV